MYLMKKVETLGDSTHKHSRLFVDILSYRYSDSFETLKHLPGSTSSTACA